MRSYPEDALQQQAMEYIRLQYPHVLAFHTANERKTTPQAGARLKRKGVIPGVSDILIFWNGGHGAIELKAGKNKMSPHQEYFSDRWQSAGGKFALCYSLDALIETLDGWNLNG